MKIIRAFPPNYSALVKAFPIRGRAVIFAWGDRIYNPAGIVITPQLLAHERVHGARQERMGVEDWWLRYVIDARFRFDEELPAHRAEVAAGTPADEVAFKLASPIYGRLIDAASARNMLAA